MTNYLSIFQALNFLTKKMLLKMKKINFLFLMFLPVLFYSQNLTGEWADDNGACYKIRQIGNQIYWTMDDSPRVLNVFKGYIVGNNITGEWADVPGGNLLGNGYIAIRIESVDRMVKIDQSDNYLGSVWTRGGCSKCDFNLSGEWRGIHVSRNHNSTGYFITQTGNQLILSYSGDGTQANASCQNNKLQLSGWGNPTGEVIDNGKRINFSNGSYWIKL